MACCQYEYLIQIELFVFLLNRTFCPVGIGKNHWPHINTFTRPNVETNNVQCFKYSNSIYTFLPSTLRKNIWQVVPQFESFGVKQMKQRVIFGMNILSFFQDPGSWVSKTKTLLCLEIKATYFCRLHFPRNLTKGGVVEVETTDNYMNYFSSKVFVYFLSKNKFTPVIKSRNLDAQRKPRIIIQMQ